jgi:hypothetical protein
MSFGSIDPSSHYWVVAGSTTEVYSGATNTYVPVNDSTYVTWSQTNQPSQIASEIELWTVMQQRAQLPDWLFDGTTFVQPAAGQYTQTQLLAYSASVRYNYEVAGTTSGSQQLRTDRVSRTALNQTLVYLNANPTLTVNWKTLTGFVAWTQTLTTTYAEAVNKHVQSCYDVETSTDSSITGGTITTLAQIDSAYSGITTAAIKAKIGI